MANPIVKALFSTGMTKIGGSLLLEQQSFVAGATNTINLSGGPVILVDTSATGSNAAMTLNTPTAANCGKNWTALIIDIGGNFLINNVTLTPGSGTINGGATGVLNLNRAMFLLTCDGTNFYIAAMTATL